MLWPIGLRSRVRPRLVSVYVCSPRKADSIPVCGPGSTYILTDGLGSASSRKTFSILSPIKFFEICGRSVLLALTYILKNRVQIWIFSMYVRAKVGWCVCMFAYEGRQHTCMLTWFNIHTHGRQRGKDGHTHRKRGWSVCMYVCMLDSELLPELRRKYHRSQI